jgi:hypothetical protein
LRDVTVRITPCFFQESCNTILDSWKRLIPHRARYKPATVSLGPSAAGDPERNSSAWSPDWSVYRPGGGSLHAQTQTGTRNVFIERGLGRTRRLCRSRRWKNLDGKGQASRELDGERRACLDPALEGQAKQSSVFFYQGIVHHGPLQFGLRPFFQIRPETGTERSRRPEPPATWDHIKELNRRRHAHVAE